MRTPGATADATRRRVLDAAIDLFAQRGYAATGVRDLGAAAGLTGPALYHYIGTKEDLLVAIMRSTIEPLVADARAIVREHDDPAEQLVALVERHVWVHATRARETLVADTEIRALQGARRDEMLALRDRYQRAWRGIVRGGADAGTFDVDDAGLATIGLLQLATGVSHWYRPGGRLGLERLCAIHADLALGMVRARRDGRPLRRDDVAVTAPG